jgi:hypothetical protein
MAKNQLFLEDYLFKGKHEEMARKLISVLDAESNTKIFNSAVELYMSAAIVGCRYNRKASIVKTDNVQTLKIMSGQFANHYHTLLFIYKLILLTSGGEDEVSSIDRINRAFRFYEEEVNIELFDSYVLGGVEILHDVFFTKQNKRYIDYLNSLQGFLEELKDVPVTSDEDDDIFVDAFDIKD